MLSKNFKLCRCCNTKAYGRQRVCKVCGVPAIWDKPTTEQQATHDADVDRRVNFMENLLKEL
jgi:hypothetical protein